MLVGTTNYYSILNACYVTVFLESIEELASANVSSQKSLLYFEHNPLTLNWNPSQILPIVYNYSKFKLRIEAYFYKMDSHGIKWELFEIHENIVENTGSIEISSFPVAPKGLVDSIIPIAFRIIVNNSPVLPNFIRPLIKNEKIGIWSHPIYMVIIPDYQERAPKLCREWHSTGHKIVKDGMLYMHKPVTCPCRVEQARVQISGYTEMKTAFEDKLREFLHPESTTCFQSLARYG